MRNLKLSAAQRRRKLGERWRTFAPTVYSRDVRHRHKASSTLLFSCIVAAGTVAAQTVPPSPTPKKPLPQETQTTPPRATPPPSAAAGVFPLAEVHRGLKGVAYTVFEGVDPQAMEVEILGVLHNALGPHEDMILARLGGKESVYTGVVAGMSGSPVYIDGKLVGALAFRIGQFSKEPIAGITPIEQMLQVRDLPLAPQLNVAATPGEMQPGAKAETQGVAAAGEIRAIETPLVFSGFGQETLRQFGDRFKAIGLEPVAGVGGGSGTAKQPEPIVPGSSVSALLVRGDMEVAATCTATYVDAKQLLACGHPITQYGGVSMPMTKAEVVATLPSPLNAFKIVNTTEEVGAFNQDRQTAIRGVFGAKAEMIPVTVRLRNPTGVGDSAERVVHFDVVDNPDLTPTLLVVSVYQAMAESNRYGAETTYNVRGRIGINDGMQVRLDELQAPTELMPSAVGTALLVGERFTRLYSNRARTVQMRSVDLEIDAEPGRRTLEIESASASHTTVRPGETVDVEAVLRPFHGAPQHVTVPFKLPATAERGPLRMVLSDAALLDRMTQTPGFGARDLDVAETVAQLNAAHLNNRLYVTMLLPSPQAIVDGRTLAAVPLSMANVLEPKRANRDLTLNGESAVPVTSVPMDAMVTGEQVVTLQVE